MRTCTWPFVVLLLSTLTAVAVAAPPRYDTMPAARPSRDTKGPIVNTTFVEIEVEGVWYTGHLAVLSNPVGHFSIQLPSGGCGNKSWTTKTAAEHGCVVATNAGFFDVSTGGCLGNIVSNGTTVQTVNGTEYVSFGLTAAGEFAIGYLNATDVAEMDFVDLVSGVGWLVRDGANYVNESVPIESITSVFETEAAPRVCIGYSADGALMILEIDGNEILLQGPGLNEMAQIALQLGFTHAINLDGGGSATFVYESTLCAFCGVTNSTCDSSGSGAAAKQAPRTRESGLAGATPRPDLAREESFPMSEYYFPCIDCGYALAEEDEYTEGRARGSSSSTSASQTVCQRQVTTITCIS